MGGDRLARIRALIEKVRGGDNNADNGSSAYAPLKTLEQAEADYNFMMLKGARK
jgi:hypothetical protein